MANEVFNKEEKTVEMERNDDGSENPEEIVFDGVFDSLEVDDIYGDLKVDSLNDMNYTELKEKYENSTAEVKSLRKLSDKLKRENDILKTNIVSLYLTAKREIDRKDGELKIYQRKEVNYQLRLHKKERGKEMEKEKGASKGGKNKKKHGVLNAIKITPQKSETGYSGDKTQIGSSWGKLLPPKDSGDGSVRQTDKNSSGNKTKAQERIGIGRSGAKTHSSLDGMHSPARQSHKHSIVNKTEARLLGDEAERGSSGDKAHSSHDSGDISVSSSQKHHSGNKTGSSETKKHHSSKKTQVSSHSRHTKDEPNNKRDQLRDSDHKSRKRKSTVHKDGRKYSKSDSHIDSSLTQPKRQKISS